MSGDSLTRGTTVRQLVAVFADVERRTRAAFAELVEAENVLNAAFTLGEHRGIRIDASNSGYNDSFDDPERALMRMRRAAWGVIVDRLELRRMMAIKRFAQLEKQIADEDPPEITEANVNAFVSQHAQEMPSMIEEAVAEVFDWLRPHASEYRSNSDLEIGPRVVLRWMVLRVWSSGPGFRVDYDRVQHLIALENVFRALAGEGAFSRTHYSEIQNQIETTKAAQGETPFFEWKCFRNRNMHLRFKRLDLLERFNQIAGGKRLRPAQGAA